MTTRISIAARNAQADAFGVLLNGGFARLYTGSQPTGPDAATGETLLVNIPLNSPAFAAASNGIITLNLPGYVAPQAAGTVGWVRLADSGGNGVIDAAYPSEITLNRSEIYADDSVGIVSFSYAVPTE